MVYLGFLIYLFLGVAFVADLFMAAIEVITSKTKTVTVKDDKNGEPHTIEVLFWNATVANLTLMALGSSAPEILLAFIETVVRLPCRSSDHRLARGVCSHVPRANSLQPTTLVNMPSSTSQRS